jgi:hypothetical protein
VANRTAALTVKLLGDSSDLTGKLDKGAGKVGKFGGAVKAAAAGVAVVGIARTLTDWGKKAEVAGSANARLAQILSQTAGAGADQVRAVTRQAESLSTLTGVSDETIKAGQAILGTFASVAQSAGETGGSFDRATTAALDLAAAGFGSVESNSVALGKALEDPTKGLAAMAESGVTFTDQQKEQIAAMQKAGDVAGAQAVILAAVEGQVGGTAAATADASAKIANSWENVQEVIGSVVLPVFEALADKLGAAATWAKANEATVTRLAAAAGALAAGLVILNVGLRIYAATSKAIVAVTKLWAAGQWLLNAAMSANPVGLVVLAVIALIAVVVLLWRRSDTFRRFMLGMWEQIERVAVATWDAIRAAAAAVWAAIRSVVRVVVAAIRAYITAYRTVVLAVWSAIRSGAAALWRGIQTVVRVVIAAIRAYITAYRTVVLAVWSAIRSGATSAFGRIRDVGRAAISAILAPVRALRSAFDRVVDAIRAVIRWLSRIRIPKITLPRIPGVGRSAAAPSTFAGAAPVRRFAAPTSTSSTTSTSSPAGVSITINGAIDPEATARQIRRILAGHDRRVGSAGAVLSLGAV